MKQELVEKVNKGALKKQSDVNAFLSELLSEHFQQGERLKSLEEAQAGLKRAVSTAKRRQDAFERDIKEEYPLLPVEADEVQKAVRKRLVEACGGKSSAAYGDKPLRRRIARDIHLELKRQYGLIDERGYQMSYKNLARKNLKAALIAIEAYELPVALENEVNALNELEEV